MRHFWPFGEASVRARLENATSAKVRFGSFHEKYFPFGCVAERVILQGSETNHANISIERLIITSNPFAMLRHQVSQLRAEGVQIAIDKLDKSLLHSKSSQTTIDNFVVNDAVLKLGDGSSQPFRLTLQSLRLQNLGGNGLVRFSAVFQNPMPAGVVRMSGSVGPWNRSDTSATAVSGQYSLENADLAVFHSIGGKVSSTGNFAGTFKALEVQGSTDSPAFELTDTHHQLPVRTTFGIRVDVVSGDMDIQSVKADFGRDQLEAQGTVARGPDHKRVALIDINCRRGRIEDTFYPFIHSPKSPLTGDVVFRMHVRIPAGGERFVKRVEFNSDFAIANAKFTNPQTEFRLSKVSDQKQSDPAPPAADIDGRVVLRAGTARFSALSVKDPGASAQLHGTYNLIDNRVDMHGQLTTTANLAKTTSGIKAVFARVLQPLVKKRHHEKIIPVKITGSFHHPSFGLDMSSRM